jgi:hypothetical protein
MADDDGTGRLEPLMGERVVRAVRRLVRQAAQSGRDRLELRQHEKDLEHFWIRLGKTARRLVEAGEIDHPALAQAIRRIDDLEAKIDGMRGRSAPDSESSDG